MIVIEYVKDVELLSNLHELIAAQEFGDNFSHITSSGGSIFVNLTAQLSESHQTVLDDLVSNFSDTLEALKVPKICDYVKEELKGKHFHDIDYKTELTQSLIPKRTVVKGEVQRVEWFQSMDVNNNPVNKILDVSIVYQRDASGFAISRQVTREWTNKDESVNPLPKLTSKYYFVNPVDQIEEGIKRRGLLVKSIQMPTMLAMMHVLMPLGQSQGQVLLQGRQFMDDYETDFSKFVASSSSITDINDPNFGKKTVVVRLEEEAEASRVLWLDAAPAILGGATIRQYLINEFTI